MHGVGTVGKVPAGLPSLQGLDLSVSDVLGSHPDVPGAYEDLERHKREAA